MAVNFDIYQNVTDRIVSAIEAGASGWRMPWHARAGGDLLALPISVAGRAYTGINIPLLWGEAIAKGYESNVWGTYRAWQGEGAQVRKGERSAMIVFWKRIEAKKTDDAPATADGRDKFRLIARGYNVFNASQVDGYKAKPIAAPAPLREGERIEHVERYFAALPARVTHGGNEAFYHRGGDYIRLPEFDQFNSPADYYSTRGHESVHWSGHKSRLDRDFTARCGGSREAYAAEELVAELGAAFLCAILGISNEPRPDHAQYLAHWLGVLQADKRMIFTAASKAQAAVNYLNGAASGEAATDEGAPDESVDLPLAA